MGKKGKKGKGGGKGKKGKKGDKCSPAEAFLNVRISKLAFSTVVLLSYYFRNIQKIDKRNSSRNK